MRKIYKKSATTSERLSFFLKKPNDSGRATFSIISRKILPSGKSKNQVIKSEALDNINRQFKDGAITNKQAELLCKELMASLVPKIAVLHNQENLKLLERYWEEEYVGRDITSPTAAKNRLLAAVEAAGHYSLISASRADLQKEVDSRYEGNRQRYRVAALNQLLKFAGRPFKLRRAREEIRTVKYLTEAQLQVLVAKLADPMLKLLHLSAFGTGLRTGELFALQPQHIKGKSINLPVQMDRDGVLRETKNRRPRTPFILPNYRKAVSEWAAIPIETKRSLRGTFFSKVTRKHSKGEFTFHDLRHSYAVFMVERGAPLNLVKQSLGNSIIVAEKFYSGFESTPQGIDLLDSLNLR